MESNDKDIQESNLLEEDKTSENDEDDKGSKFKTIDAQRKKWREKAIDSETGKTYKELYQEALKVKEDKTSQTNDSKQKDPTELDDGRKALWRSYAQIQGADEWALVKEEVKRSGTTDPEELSQNPYFKQRLETLRTAKANTDAASGSSNKSGGGEKNSVEAILARLGPLDEIPADLPRETRLQLVEARRNKGKGTKKFFND